MAEASTHTMSIVVAGGGTAGHIEPALAVAEALRDDHGASVTALGTTRGLETTLVPERGFDLELINPVPVPRSLTLDLVKLPIRVVAAVQQTREILKKVDADALIGFGGYVAAPAYLAARSLGIPFYVHEANSVAGMANKLGVKLGGIGLNAVEDSGMEGEVVGVPVRKGLTGDRDGEDAKRARNTYGLDADRTTILITGGSQGAVSLNKAVAASLDSWLDAGFQVLHAVGNKNELPSARDGYVPVHFISDMAGAYAVADLIICRAGAMTVTEVTAAGVPAIYVPLPHGNGEQGLNAREVVEAGAATLIDDSDLPSGRLNQEVMEILSDPRIHARMTAAARNSGGRDVAGDIARRIVDAIKQQR